MSREDKDVGYNIFNRLRRGLELPLTSTVGSEEPFGPNILPSSVSFYNLEKSSAEDTFKLLLRGIKLLALPLAVGDAIPIVIRLIIGGKPIKGKNGLGDAILKHELVSKGLVKVNIKSQSDAEADLKGLEDRYKAEETYKSVMDDLDSLPKMKTKTVDDYIKDQDDDDDVQKEIDDFVSKQQVDGAFLRTLNQIEVTTAASQNIENGIFHLSMLALSMFQVIKRTTYAVQFFIGSRLNDIFASMFQKPISFQMAISKIVLEVLKKNLSMGCDSAKVLIFAGIAASGACSEIKDMWYMGTLMRLQNGGMTILSLIAAACKALDMPLKSFLLAIACETFAASVERVVNYLLEYTKGQKENGDPLKPFAPYARTMNTKVFPEMSNANNNALAHLCCQIINMATGRNTTSALVLAPLPEAKMAFVINLADIIVRKYTAVNPSDYDSEFVRQALGSARGNIKEVPEAFGGRGDETQAKTSKSRRSKM